MMEEFKRYCSLQRDQKPLASLLIYFKRKGGWVQLNQIWRDLGPSSGGPYWNQTTLINKLDKLERLEIISVERRVLPSARSEDKKKTNTFCRLNPLSPVSTNIFSMLKIYTTDSDQFSSEMVDKPLDRLNDSAVRSERGNPAVERELEVALELIGEVFNIGDVEARKMIKDRMARRGLLEKKESPKKGEEEMPKPKRSSAKSKSKAKANVWPEGFEVTKGKKRRARTEKEVNPTPDQEKQENSQDHEDQHQD